MSERGRGGYSRGSGRGGNRGGISGNIGRTNTPTQNATATQVMNAGKNANNKDGKEIKEKKKKDNILDLSKYVDKKIRVKFTGGREVMGILKGFDPLLNIVLDETVEYLKDLESPDAETTEKTRELGLLVCRGPSVFLICPVDGSEEIENPFLAAE